MKTTSFSRAKRIVSPSPGKLRVLKKQRTRLARRLNKLAVRAGENIPYPKLNGYDIA